MTTITAEVIADSVSEYGKRITTFKLRYPRWIHAEGRTHRQLYIGEGTEFDLGGGLTIEPSTPSLMDDPNLSRNASSSRAVPVEKLIQDILDDTAIPLYWGADQRGMQAGEELAVEVNLFDPETGGDTFMEREAAWLWARDQAIIAARAFGEAGYHKQVVNRLLEPFSHINVVVTATEWDNFYGLRRHSDAEPHIHLLADRMWEAQEASTPVALAADDWHLPFVSTDDGVYLAEWLGQNHKPIELLPEYKIKLSVARCASVSYTTVDGQPMTPERALSLYDRLLSAQPLHASPAEHQAKPDVKVRDTHGARTWMRPHLHGNFVGFVQYRKTLLGECITA